jgi:DNA replication protein DnaC
MNKLEMPSLDDCPTRTDVCEKHGDYEARNFLKDIWSKCPTCADEKKEEERLQQLAEQQERADRAWRSRVNGACIPERFKDRTLDTYIAETEGQKHALEFAQQYANEFDLVRSVGRCAIFVGNPGTGKTHLAIGIALHILKQQKTVLFTTVQRAIRRVKDTWTKDSSETETAAINSIAYPYLLILDEVGVQFGSEFERQVIFDILNERYEKRKPTILLSNIPAKDLGGYLGDRVADRLKEDGGKLIQFTWDSHRRKK